MNLDPLRDLAAGWRDEADAYERDGAIGPLDRMLRRVAGELESALGQWWTEPLDLETGADEIGSTYDALRKRVARGSVRDVGSPGSPRVRRCDLYGDGPGSHGAPGSHIAQVLDEVVGAG